MDHKYSGSFIEQALSGYEGRRLQPKKIVICTHAKQSIIELCKVLTMEIPEIIFFPVNYSKDNESIAALKTLGVRVIDDEQQLIREIEQADVIIEDGARLSRLINKHSLTLKQGFFSVEQTSGGIRYLRENPPSYPVIDVAYSPVKLDIENRRATPESVIQTFSEATGKTLGGKHVLIIGFGSIGEGLARYARILGATVTVCDSSSVRNMFAGHRGYRSLAMSDLDPEFGNFEVIFMATNRYEGDVIDVEQLLLLQDGAIICNAGSGTGELAPRLLEEGEFEYHDARVTVHKLDEHLVLHLEKASLKKTITILGMAYPINLHLGKGTSHDAIEIVMTLMMLALFTGTDTTEAGIIPLSPDIQAYVAALRQVDQNNINDVHLSPLRIGSDQLAFNSRPYGGIFPFHNEINSQAHFSVVRAQFEPGSKTRGHYHRRSQEAYYVERGSANIITWHRDNTSEKTTHNLGNGEYLFIPQYYFHDVQVTSDEEFVCLVIASPPFSPWDQFFQDDGALS